MALVEALRGLGLCLIGLLAVCVIIAGAVSVADSLGDWITVAVFAAPAAFVALWALAEGLHQLSATAARLLAFGRRTTWAQLPAAQRRWTDS